jgi:CheY-like chemotaxis protein
MTPVSNKSLLITDDDADFRETLCAVFQPRGFRTLTAGDGQEALQILRREPIHLLLCDMHMPRLDGLETVRRVKELYRALPCILMSAKLDDHLTEAARRADVYSSLAKPIRLPEMLQLVHQALRGENAGC